MDYAAQVDSATRDMDALIAAVAAGPTDVQVPTCPDFTVDTLAEHIGRFCTTWTHALVEGTPPSDVRTPPLSTEGGAAPGDPAGRVDWLAALAERFLATLAAASPDDPAWTWFEPDQTTGFIARRASHELAIHRVDMQLARGAADPVDSVLAADGIDEIFTLQAYGAPFRPDTVHGTGQTLHLHGTDVEDRGIEAEWLVTLAPDGLHVTREHAKGDLALRGAVGDLELLLYQRPTHGEIQHFGDDAVLAQFYEEFTFG